MAIAPGVRMPNPIEQHGDVRRLQRGVHPIREAPVAFVGHVPEVEPATAAGQADWQREGKRTREIDALDILGPRTQVLQIEMHRRVRRDENCRSEPDVKAGHRQPLRESDRRTESALEEVGQARVQPGEAVVQDRVEEGRSVTVLAGLSR